tara:strand:- start:384 stop:683 length:300 start_codon:yes stop_codon:yes gene_type:complete
MAHYSPAYYTRGSIECWDAIRDWKLNYHLGCAVKYICRAGFKDANSKAQDLKKAIHYLENELQHTLNIAEPVRPSHGIPYSLWDPELQGEPDYATGFDR